VAAFLFPGASVPDSLSFPILSLDPPDAAGPGSLVFLGARTRLTAREALSRSGAALVILQAGEAPPRGGMPVILVKNAHAAMAACLQAWEPRWERVIPFAFGGGNRIAPSAVVEGCLEGDVIVGPGAYIGPGTFVGSGSRIGANAVIEANVRLGRDCVVQSGAVIGCQGFGFYPRRAAPQAGLAIDGETLLSMPHPAGVVIGDGCWIGANTVIAAGVLRPTTLGKGCKLDSHVQVAHNVTLGDGCLLASQSGLAGSTVSGHRLRLGGAASVDGHLRLGDDVSVAACSGVTKDLPDGSVVAGFPARPLRAWRREQIGNRGGRPD
jgi:UDP-3-O-[3-hydroxymyristoyl] glucosamine N-acyltransferase